MTDRILSSERGVAAPADCDRFDTLLPDYLESALPPAEKRRRNHGAHIKDLVVHQRRTLSAESEAAVPEGVPVQGQFMGVEVELAHLKTDAKGRLVVIGPQGQYNIKRKVGGLIGADAAQE